jgi:cytochrome c peroxidase
MASVMRILSLGLILIGLLALMPSGAVKWPERVYKPSALQQEQASIDLGRMLFYDPILSRDSSISCASCHSSYVAFTHVDHAVSHGIEDRIGRRNAPALMNLAWSQSFMWDGAINHLDMQPLAPISNALEMDEQLPNVIRKLQRSSLYQAMFNRVYGDSLVTTERMLKAFSAFLITLESRSSKYDQMLAGTANFTEQESRGYNLFRQQCNQCHTEPLFTNNAYRNNGIVQNGRDFGRGEVTGISTDSGLFKVPTLRNIQYSRPYMHDGRYAKLNEVVRHYATGDFSESASVEMSQVKAMSEEQRVDLMAFLLTLSDSAFVFDKRHQYPFKLFEASSVRN